jgi:hypothetical protein
LQTLSEDNYCQDRIPKVREGIRFLLSHVEGRQQLFPRKMSTALTKGSQFIVYSEDQILNECIKANFIDCRLNAYPHMESDDLTTITNTDSHTPIRIFSALAPNLIFIDIDFPPGITEKDSLKQLNKILEIIKKDLGQCTPSVLWTGNGFHIYIVLDTRPLELIVDLTALSKEPSHDFLRFAEARFSGKKADPKHNPSFKSYLLRIPHTLNSKCIKNGKDPEVKIIQRFDAENIPKIGIPLLREFRLYLADQDIKNKFRKGLLKNRQGAIVNYSTQQACANNVPKCYLWIENRLLLTPISDHRKYTIDLVLAPFLTNIKHLSYDETCSMIEKWILRCNSVNRLQPSLVYFENKIENTVKNSIDKCILPIKKETMAAKYPEWFTDFRRCDIFD